MDKRTSSSLWRRSRPSLLLTALCISIASGSMAAQGKGSSRQQPSAVTVGESLMPSRTPYSKFDPWLQKLLKEIDIVDAERKRYNAAYKALEKDLVSALKEEDPLFKAIFSELHPTGSSFEGLRILKPNEFDMNAVLNLPLEKKEDIEVLKDESAGHMMIMSKKTVDDYYNEPWFSNHIKQKGEERNLDSIRNTLLKWWNGRYLSRVKVLEWMQSAVDRALVRMNSHKNLPLWNIIKTISRRRSGPAVTLEVCTRNGDYFSVDFVPALTFREDTLPKAMKARVKAIAKKRRDWYLIPKGPAESAAKVWRASLWDHEKDYLTGLEHFKPLVRLLKKLRDEQNWPGLASYYVKTAAMFIVEDVQDGGREYFKRSIGDLVMRGLKQLQDSTTACDIPFFWDKGHNLLEKMNRATCLNISKRLNVVFKSFEKSLTDDKEDPMVYFGTLCGKCLTTKLVQIVTDDDDSELMGGNTAAHVWLLGRVPGWTKSGVPLGTNPFPKAANKCVT